MDKRQNIIKPLLLTGKVYCAAPDISVAGAAPLYRMVSISRKLPEISLTGKR